MVLDFIDYRSGSHVVAWLLPPNQLLTIHLRLSMRNAITPFEPPTSGDVPPAHSN